jgi:hypothetical protein
MDDMREIVTVEQVNRLFLLLAFAGPVAGLLIGAALGARRGSAARGAIVGLLVGALGILNLGLWTLYNALTDRMGLDSVKNLLVNLALFVGLGIAAGFGLGRLARRRWLPSSSEGGGSAPVGAVPGGPAPSRSPGATRRPEESSTSSHDS